MLAPEIPESTLRRTLADVSLFTRLMSILNVDRSISKKLECIKLFVFLIFIDVKVLGLKIDHHLEGQGVWRRTWKLTNAG